MIFIIALIKSEFTGKRRSSLEAVPVFPLGLPAILVTLGLPRNLSEKRLSKLLDRCAATLSASRVRRILPHRDFEYADRLFDMGFSRLDCRELLRAKAGPILSGAALKHDRALISSLRADAATLRAFRELANNFRHITLDMPAPEARRLADRLWDLGLTPEPLSRARTVEADAAAFFTAPEKPVFLPSRCVFLAPEGPGGGILGGRELERARFTLPAVSAPALPDGFAPAALLSEALASGRLSPADVSLA